MVNSSRKKIENKYYIKGEFQYPQIIAFNFTYRGLRG